MKLKTYLLTLCLFSLVLCTTAATNLLSNGDFENAKTNPLFGAEFTDWAFGGVIAIETTDIHGGTKALRTEEVTTRRSLIQDVNLRDDVVGQEYEIKGYYKVLSANQGDLALNCLWECVPPHTGTPHDSVILNQPLDVTSTGWQSFSVTTTKPQNGTTFYFSVAVNKGVKVIFDDFSLTRTEKTEPWFTVTPETISQSDCSIGDSVLVADFLIRQGNLTLPIDLYITGTNRTMWRLEKTQVTAAEENVKLWYKPTAIGKHAGAFLIESTEAQNDNKMYSLSGTCIDPTQSPTITINPATLPVFRAAVGQTVEDSVALTSENCIDHVYATISPAGTGFTIDRSLILKNTSTHIYITFSPSVVGTTTATITFTTARGESKTISVTGEATEPAPEVVDWQTDFDWKTRTPQTLLIEPFDAITHNKTLLLNEWQNVVKTGTRPWWGYKDINNDNEPCAKASAYISGVTDSTLFTMWLVTPPLDYKNAANQVFTFRVRGDYLLEGQSATLKLYYIDATNTADVYFEDLQIAMPSTADEAGEWLDFQVNLTGLTTIADVFYMGFCFTGYSGTNGSATYLIDDVSWGRTDLPLITADSTQVVAITQPNKTVSVPITVQTKNLTEPVSVTVAGSNKSDFSLSESSLPTTGGTFILTFKSANEGVHQAYLRLRSRGAVEVRIPMAVLVKNNLSVEDINDPTSQTKQSRVVLRNGLFYIVTRSGTTYTITGSQIY